MLKRKNKKTGVQTPEFRKPSAPPPPPTSGSNAVKPNPNYVPPDSTPQYNPPPTPLIKPAKKENATMNKTMYGLNLYIPFEELDAYIHERIDKNYGDLTFVPAKVEINELDLSIDIKLLSASSVEIDNNRYKLDLNALSKENNQ